MLEWAVIVGLATFLTFSLTSIFYRRVKPYLTSPYTEDDEDAPRYCRRSEKPR